MLLSTYHTRTQCPNRATSAAHSMSARKCHQCAFAASVAVQRVARIDVGHYCLRISHKMTIFVCLLCILHIPYPFLAFEVHWGHRHRITRGPAAMASGATLWRYPRFVFLSELHCSVILTTVVFSLSPLFTSVQSRSHDLIFNSKLRSLLYP